MSSALIALLFLSACTSAENGNGSAVDGNTGGQGNGKSGGNGAGAQGPGSGAGASEMPKPASRPPAPETTAKTLDLDELAALSLPAEKFTFHPGDLLEISIFEEPEFKNVEIRLSTEMKINFPYAGVIDLKGMGIIELENELKRRLEANMLNQAQVSVLLKTPAQRWVYSLGELNYPQAFEIPPLGSLCVADVISLSRGFTDDADRRMVEISRTVDGNLVEFLLQREHFKTFFLLPGDKIRVLEAKKVYVRGEVREPGALVIPEYGMTVEEALTRSKVKEDADLRNVTLERRTDERISRYRGVPLDFQLEPGDMLVAPDLRKVYVIGSVQKPGGYTIPTGGLRATMAVALAEGWSRLAAPNSTYVKRKMPDGGTRVFEVPLKDIMQGKYPEKNIELEPGDEVYVPESFF